jgi:LmbE family N-acetylglucosaminyl deacetylase
MMDFWEGWENPKRILAIFAHPDDPEFFCGATIARWIEHGHHVTYCIMTRGDKGSHDPNVIPAELAVLREEEQRAAACVLGVQAVRFLSYPDGQLMSDLETRAAVARVVREEKPDIVVTTDPTNFFPSDTYINHPDHRTAGEITIDAVYPAAYLPHYYPDQIKEGLAAHRVEEIWLTLTGQPNVVIDVSAYWEKKTQALLKHLSQIGDPEQFAEGIRTWHTPDSTFENPRFEETFRRFVLYRGE